jgi:hypothetical protein
MKAREITARRLQNQLIASRAATSAEEVVTALGALQAQDHPGALWSIALRSAHTSQKEVERAIDARKIVRTWPMRGTLHFVPAADIRWMLDLTRERMNAVMIRRRAQLALDAKAFTKAEKVLLAAMRGAGPLARSEALGLLDRAGVATEANRGAHVLHFLAHEGLLCFGPHAGKQPTFVLLDEWIPAAAARTRDEALALLAERYFTSHGPATVADFAWWIGLTRGEARRAIDLARPALVEVKADGLTYHMPDRALDARPAVHLLPGFDEYMLGYTDRSAALAPAHAHRICPGGNGMFLPTFVVGGEVKGTWKRTAGKSAVTITITTFGPVSAAAREGAVRAARRYGEHTALTPKVTFV